MLDWNTSGVCKKWTFNIFSFDLVLRTLLPSSRVSARILGELHLTSGCGKMLRTIEQCLEHEKSWKIEREPDSQVFKIRQGEKSKLHRKGRKICKLAAKVGRRRLYGRSDATSLVEEGGWNVFLPKRLRWIGKCMTAPEKWQGKRLTFPVVLSQPYGHIRSSGQRLEKLSDFVNTESGLLIILS